MLKIPEENNKAVCEFKVRIDYFQMIELTIITGHTGGCQRTDKMLICSVEREC